MARILFAALLLLFTLPAAAQTPGDSIAFVTADWHTTDLGRGAACRHAQVEMFGSRQSILDLSALDTITLNVVFEVKEFRMYVVIPV